MLAVSSRWQTEVLEGGNMQSFYTDPVPAKPCRSLAVSDGSSSEIQFLGCSSAKEKSSLFRSQYLWCLISQMDSGDQDSRNPVAVINMSRFGSGFGVTLLSFWASDCPFCLFSFDFSFSGVVHVFPHTLASYLDKC